MKPQLSDYVALADAAKRYQDAVKNLWAARDDGPCLADRKPSQDDDCLDAFVELDRAGKSLTKAREVIAVLHAKALLPSTRTSP